MSDPDATLAYRAESSIEARALAAYLDKAGIRTRIVGEPLETAYAGLNLSQPAPVEVWISPNDREAAAPLIAAWQAQYNPAHATDGERSPEKFQFSLLTLLLVMTAVAWLITSMTLGSDLGSALTSLFMALLLIVGILSYRHWQRRRHSETTKSTTPESYLR